jgi:transposase
MDEPACPGCRELSKQVAELTARVAELTRKLDEATRAAKRQAAPFRKGPPKPNPKKPGRKSGDAHGRHGHRPPPPGPVAESLVASLPEVCPRCSGPLIPTGTAEQFQTEIPRQPLIRQFTVHLGHCGNCGRHAQGRHPLQTSDALGAAASQIGPDAQAAVALLHTQAGLSHGKVAAVFGALFGITLTRGASAQINGRAGTRLEPECRRILASIRASKQLSVDETGWRVGGQPAWLHVWVGDRATAYAIDSQRSAEALEREIGIDWSGVLCHDGYSTYDRFERAIHQSCLAHVLRRVRELLASATRCSRRRSTGGTSWAIVWNPTMSGSAGVVGSTTGCWPWCGPGGRRPRTRRWRSTCTSTWSSGSHSCSIRPSSPPTGGPSRRSARRWSTARCGAGTEPEPVRTRKGSSCPCSRRAAGTPARRWIT